ncbi:hypothetical protein NC796_06435 [Aliifodinibius sp. S!AR15-10]|uniref:hypothetical protein n=1 Tax=Aliifodinibius sp. S!AR15-10 TaxID=2950437 RepID=UPI00285A39C4|nr:hypothetical protein [Aliifodinibius sp. S!AR15-10]MDR8390765.1 hypothetical protein [Aliifodinibius sp. S!AR15-10]
MDSDVTLTDLQWPGNSRKEQERRESLLFHFFSVYAEHYNRQRVAAQADFAAILDLLGMTSDSKHQTLEKKKDRFKNEIVVLSEQYHSQFGNIDASAVEYYKARIIELVDEISMPEEICYPDIDEIVDELRGYTVEFAKIIFKEKSIDSAVPIFKGIFDLHAYYNGYIDHRIHMTSLGLVIHKVNQEGYPKRIKLSEELDQQEKEAIKGEVFKSYDLQKNDYWITAYELYSNDRTWEEVYGVIEKLRADLGLVPKYTSFDSFKRAKSRFDKQRRSGTK